MLYPTELRAQAVGFFTSEPARVTRLLARASVLQPSTRSPDTLRDSTPPHKLGRGTEPRKQTGRRHARQNVRQNVRQS